MPNYAYEDVDHAERAREWQDAVIKRLALLKECRATCTSIGTESDIASHSANAQELLGAVRIINEHLSMLALIAIDLGELEKVISAAVTGR